MLESGLWIAFEGPDGVGKTTVMKAVADVLKGMYADLEILQTSHPGATPLGRHLRTLTKHPEQIDPNIVLDPISEQLLMMVDHANFKAHLLEPALQRGAIMLADRCNLISGLAYGMAAGLSATQMNAMFHLTAIPRVDRVYLLRCAPALCRRRLLERDGVTALDRFERRVGVAEIYDSLLTGPTERTILVNRVVALDNVRYVDSARPVSDVVLDIIKDIRSLIINHAST